MPQAKEIMSLSSEGTELRDRFLAALLEAARPLQAGADPEVTLEALVEAAELLRDRLRAELAELRREQAD
jgi:hypothetical protein